MTERKKERSRRGVEGAWVKEIERRIDDCLAGRGRFFTVEESMKRLDQAIQRVRRKRAQSKSTRAPTPTPSRRRSSTKRFQPR
jgi:hypothetical protein